MPEQPTPRRGQWPATARPGYLIACDEPPGCLTHNDTPLLFVETATPWLPGRPRLDPAPGTVVIEVGDGGLGRVAVVR